MGGKSLSNTLLSGEWLTKALASRDEAIQRMLTNLDTVAADHGNCSVGSWTHGFIPLEEACRDAATTTG